MLKLRYLRYTLIISVLKVRMTLRGYHKMRRWTGRSITQKSHDSTIKATESLALLRPGKNYWLVPVSPCEFRRAIKEVSSKGSFTLSRGKGKKKERTYFLGLFWQTIRVLWDLFSPARYLIFGSSSVCLYRVSYGLKVPHRFICRRYIRNWSSRSLAPINKS